MKKILAKSIFFYFCLVFFFAINSGFAKFQKVECVSGNCNLNLFVDEDDLLKNYSHQGESINLKLDAKKVDVSNNFSKTFKLITYEQKNGLNDVLSVTNVLFPKHRFKLENLKTDIKIRPFLGNKTLLIGLHNSAGQLLSTYRINMHGTGNISPKNNLNKNSTISFECIDSAINDCNLQKLFFNKVFFEASKNQKSKDTYVIKNPDNTYTVEIPIVSPFGHKHIKTVVDNKAVDNNSGVSPNSNLNGFVETLNAEVVNLIEANERAIFDMDEANKQIEIGFDNNFPVMSLDNAGNIGIGNDDPQTRLDIKASNGLAPLNFAAQTLVNPIVNGAFEFDGNELYFSINGNRYFIVRDPNSATISNTSATPPNFVTSVSDTDKLGGQNASYYSNASSLNTGTLNIARLPSNLGAFKLRNVSANKFLTLQGGHDIILRSQADSNIDLPNKNGTLLTTAEVVLAPGSVTTAKVLNGTILNEDIADNTITGADILNIDAAKFSSGTFSNSVLPNREIAEINNLQTELNNRISKSSDIVDNLNSTSTDKVLSANQGRVIKQLIDSYTNNYASTNQALADVNLDFTAFHNVLSKTLSSNTSFTASNLKQGHKIILLMSGNFTPSFPSNFQFIQGTYNPIKNNVLEFEVASTISGSEKVWVKVLSN